MAMTDEIERALAHITPDCHYSTWYRVARAIYHGLGDAGFDLFDRWSSGSRQGKYPGRQGCRHQWEHAKRLDQITVRTLFHLAQNPDEQ
jgi:putative DNA primase/helicase